MFHQCDDGNTTTKYSQLIKNAGDESMSMKEKRYPMASWDRRYQVVFSRLRGFCTLMIESLQLEV